jgi:uncharacterized protein YyaL (SSP411 family)
MKYSLFLFLTLSICIFACKSPNGQTNSNNDHDNDNDNEQHAHTNQLINESSPYLLQHAHNPVDWHPWGEKALAKAKAENKLLIISVGYAACHWCHVMEHESFEDSLVAAMMNEHFVPIKVDREERPDVDDVYMTACHMSSGGSCGWPLNAFALADGSPIWAGTYFPKDDWIGVLKQFINLKEKNPAKLQEYADQMNKGLQEQINIPINVGDALFSAAEVKSVTDKMIAMVDMKKGGRKVQGGRGNKFPMPNNWMYLLREYQMTGNQKALDATVVTLDKMADGGIYDQLGGGFARYSTDPDWKAPHFEKMLYDNGQLVSLYAQAYQVTGNERYKEIVEQTLEFVKREMTHKSGGFYSSYDADSEGEEGLFYVWDKSDVEKLITDPQHLKVFCEYYNVFPNGNWEHSNILYITKPLSEIAKKNDITLEQAEAIIAAAKPKLFQERTKRIYPGLDDKVLTSWNALMMKGYVDAYKGLGDEEYKTAALKNANFIVNEVLQSDGRLNRNYKDGNSVINAFLDDYALMIEAFVAVYEMTFDEAWLNRAKLMTDYVITHFTDDKSKMFFYTSDIDPPLVVRKMETSDNVIPASNSSMAKALFLVGTYFYDNAYIERAKTMVNNMKDNVVQHPQPAFFTNWATVMSFLATAPNEIAIIGDNAEALRKEMQKEFLPNALYLGGKSEGNLELLSDKLVEGETYIYVCRNKTCKRPVQTVKEALEAVE